MKSVGLVVLGLSAVVRGSLEVEVCSDSVNLFGIKDVDLGEFVVAGEEVDVKFSQVPNQYIGKGHVKIEMQVEGVNVQTVHHSLCEVTDCHIVPHVESKSSASFKIPEKVASGFKTSLKIVINDHDGKQLSCVTVDGVKVQKKQTLLKSEKHVSVGEHACMSKDELEFLYNKWSIEHGIRFVGDKLIERMKVFADNLENIAKHNMNKEHTYQLGLNEFAHLTQEEFSETHFGYSGGENKPEKRKYFSTISEDMMDTLSNDVPNEIDWTKKGAVTSVKNQGSCGSCWSFSTTGALEGAYFLKTGKLVSFSEQELVSCDKVDQGCNGGLMDNADKWIEKNGGLCSEEDYPYVSGGGAFKQCKEDNCKNVPGSAVKSYVDVEHSEAALEKAIAKTPVAIAIEADQMSFQFYSKGVLTGRCGAQLDHGVLAVGYGTLDGVKYYKVKNSWGPSWGMNGYILLERGKEVKGGECGILLSASYPVL